MCNAGYVNSEKRFHKGPDIILGWKLRPVLYELMLKNISWSWNLLRTAGWLHLGLLVHLIIPSIIRCTSYFVFDQSVWLLITLVRARLVFLSCRNHIPSSNIYLNVQYHVEQIKYFNVRAFYGVVILKVPNH